MIIEEYFIEKLENCGMFKSQATEVIKILKTKPELFGSIKWGDKTSDYPEVVFITMWYLIVTEALSWIDENAPLSWFRAMLECEIN